MLENLTEYTRRHVRRTLAKLKFKSLINETRKRFNRKDFVGTKFYTITPPGKDLVRTYRSESKGICINDEHRKVEQAITEHDHDLQGLARELDCLPCP